MRLLDQPNRRLLNEINLYLTAHEARELIEGLQSLLERPDATDHDHVFDKLGHRTIIFGIMTPSKLSAANRLQGKWTEFDREVLSGAWDWD